MPRGLDHQPPQDTSEFTAGSDLLFTGPGIREPVAFALKDGKGKNDKAGQWKDNVNWDHPEL